MDTDEQCPNRGHGQSWRPRAPPIPDDTTEFLHRRADTKHNVTCDDGLRVS